MFDARRDAPISVGLTLASIALTETASHVFHVESTLSAGLFLLGLVPIAYAGLRAGLVAGLTCTLLLAAYALHYTSPHASFVTWTLDAWRSFAIILVLGLAMSWPMSIVRARESAFRSALEKRNAELTELNAALESFGYMVSHDLKEPVRAIENYLSAAREDPAEPESRRFVEEAYAANQRLAVMLQGLLEYSRASSEHKLTRSLDVGEIVQADACRSQYARYFDEHNVRMEVEPIPPVRGDPVLLSQLFGNLLLNAARHNSSEKPVVRIASGPPVDGGVHVVVSDNGAGYPPDVLARFSGPPRGGSTVKGGFGLIIAHRAAQRLGGRLWLENGADGGAQAHVELPAG